MGAKQEVKGGRGRHGFLILGVDPGLADTGYAVLQLPSGPGRPDNPWALAARRPPKVLEAGLLRTTASTPLPRRLEQIHRGLKELFAQYAVSVVAVEDLYSNYRHPATALLMAHARGVVLLAAGQAGADVAAFPPAKVKQALTGRGNASKEQVQHMVQNYLQLKQLPRPDHVADAMAVALAYTHLPAPKLVATGRGNR